MILFIFHPHRRAISPSSYYIMRGTKRVLPVVNSPSYLRLLLQLLLLETDAVSEEGEPFFDQLGASTFIPMAGLVCSRSIIANALCVIKSKESSRPVSFRYFSQVVEQCFSSLGWRLESTALTVQGLGLCSPKALKVYRVFTVRKSKRILTS